MAGYVPVPRAASAEGARIEMLKAPRGWSSCMGSGVSSAPSGVRGGPGRQRILGLFQGLRSLLVETMHYGVYKVL